MRHQECAREPKRRVQQSGDPNQFRILEFDFKSNSEFRTTLHSN
jgi:hypothetical protein